MKWRESHQYPRARGRTLDVLEGKLENGPKYQVKKGDTVAISEIQRYQQIQSAPAPLPSQIRQEQPPDSNRVLWGVESVIHFDTLSFSLYIYITMLPFQGY